MAGEMREFTAEELKDYNGQDGRPVYVAYEGRVYDVTESKLWKTGTHMKRHPAGTDLTGEIENAPHETDVLERFPQVGTIAAAQAPEPEADFSHLPPFLATLLRRFPFFERHPHPMTVHFPIVFNIAAPLFLLLYLATGVRALEITAFYLLIGAVFFSLVAIPTGFLTWWINYFARPVRAVTIKIVLSSLLFATGAVALILRWQNPAIATDVAGTGLLYVILVFLLFPIVSAIGWFGATLTFPIPKRRERRTGDENRQDTVPNKGD